MQTEDADKTACYQASRLAFPRSLPAFSVLVPGFVMNFNDLASACHNLAPNILLLPFLLGHSDFLLLSHESSLCPPQDFCSFPLSRGFFLQWQMTGTFSPLCSLPQIFIDVFPWPKTEHHDQSSFSPSSSDFFMALKLHLRSNALFISWLVHFLSFPCNISAAGNCISLATYNTVTGT